MGPQPWRNRLTTSRTSWMLLAAVAYVLLPAATGAAVMSVDLGSEWMKVGVVSQGVPMEIALNKESKRKTPTAIAFRDGDRVVGEDAYNIGVRFPANNFAYLIDLLGKTIDNPMVELYRKRFPYYDIVEDPTRKTVVFRNGEDLYTIEELIAQILQVAKGYAEDSTGQTVTQCVLIVPGFFGQAERQALVASARLANLNVLQLMNDYTAVALNYGIFRRKEFNETAQYFIFYDMGAYKTTASVISYQLVKDKVSREILPVVQVIGVGYDRTLGGLEMQVRLRDFLGQEFNKMGKTKSDVFSSPRAMAKLFKEAGRLKNVLSANTEHYAQIEGLLDEQDFRLLVTREQFENLCKDLFGRVTGPIERALASSGLSIELISQVVLFGGNTRVPKIQEVLKSHIKQELGKNLNADEAACMGAVYRAADLATGFRVNKFVVKDAVLFPIHVVFSREGEGGSTKQVRRTLFGAMNAYPQKKVISFNKHTDDFEFSVDYSDLDSVLSTEEIRNMGSLNLTRVSLKEVGKKINSSVTENVVSKGIKAHFSLDDSGLFSLANVELVLEKTVKEEDESTLKKLGNTISKLFSGDSDDDKGTVVEEGSQQDNSKDAESSDDQKPEEPVNTTSTTENATVAGAADSSQNKTDTVKTVTLKKQIPSEIEVVYVKPLDGAEFDSSLAKIRSLNEIDRNKKRRETALNALESFVIDAQVRLDEDEYASCATADEVDSIRKSCAEISDWLYEDGADADADTYEQKLNELRTVANQVYARHWEHKERPEALSALKQMIKGAEDFLNKAKNFTKEGNPEKDVFTQVEIDTLERVIKETTEWRKTEAAEQDKLARNVAVRLTVKDLTDKMALLDREVKYLVNKLKLWRPKVKPTPPPKVEKNGEEKEEAAEQEGEQPVLEESPQDSENGLNEEKRDINPTQTEDDTGEEHTEL
ncbi:hypoxia up-regulated protein 1 [Malaya genurostris]|uniref:hypoxia up-regulated protein 1 n=1 Tax=Malaya genurostris TaxID=325434 RepID=UPI0026F3F2B6|nr:hypoxia up-regulated protein 1 [Malaya genurostris]